MPCIALKIISKILNSILNWLPVKSVESDQSGLCNYLLLKVSDVFSILAIKNYL